LLQVLALTAIVGLLLAPMTPPAMAMPMQGAMSEHAIADSSAGAMDGMPCCPDKPALPDCGKECPFTALCGAIVLYVVPQTTLPFSPTLAAVVLPVDSSALISLAHAPPRKPPKA
jgi:hypothetical protein